MFCLNRLPVEQLGRVAQHGAAILQDLLQKSDGVTTLVVEDVMRYVHELRQVQHELRLSVGDKDAHNVVLQHDGSM